MSNGEMLYLALVIVAAVAFMATLAWVSQRSSRKLDSRLIESSLEGEKRDA
jgi:hypothetical protein